jgi:hypothetical protein
MAVTERNRLPEQGRASRFHQHVLADVDYLKSRGYNPARFLGMIAEEGSALAVAKRLFSSSRPISYGFERLWEMGGLGRTVEFVANLPWFSDLFTKDELDVARSRLVALRFPLEERLAAAAAHPRTGPPTCKLRRGLCGVRPMLGGCRYARQASSSSSRARSNSGCRRGSASTPGG